jgi:hypothetical protein
MNASWGASTPPILPTFEPPNLPGPNAPDPVFQAAREAHLALQQQKALDRAVADARAAQVPVPKPDPTVLGGLLQYKQEGGPFQVPPVTGPAWQPSGDLNGDGVISMTEAVIAPGSWTSPVNSGTLGQAPIQTDPNDLDTDFIPDPVFIVQTNGFPGGFEHWGLEQRLGWIRAVVQPYINFPRVRERLAQAEGILYEQYAKSRGGPF